MTRDSEIGGVLAAADKTMVLSVNGALTANNGIITDKNGKIQINKGAINVAAGKAVITGNLESNATMDDVVLTGDVRAAGGGDLVLSTAGSGKLVVNGKIEGVDGHDIRFNGIGPGEIIAKGPVNSKQDIVIDGTNHATTITELVKADRDVVIKNTDHLIKFISKLTVGSLKIGEGAQGLELSDGVVGSVVFTDNGILKLGGNVTGDIDATAAGGTLTMTRDSEIGGDINGSITINTMKSNVIIAGSVGKTQSLKSLEINGGSFTTHMESHIDTVNFKDDGIFKMGGDITVKNSIDATKANATFIPFAKNIVISGGKINTQSHHLTLGAAGNILEVKEGIENASNITFAGNIISGPIHGSNTTMTLNSYELTLNNGGRLEGDVVLKVKLAGDGNDSTKYGHINVKGGELDLSSTNSTQIEIIDSTGAEIGVVYKIIEGNTKYNINSRPEIINKSSPLILWSYFDAGGVQSEDAQNISVVPEILLVPKFNLPGAKALATSIANKSRNSMVTEESVFALMDLDKNTGPAHQFALGVTSDSNGQENANLIERTISRGHTSTPAKTNASQAVISSAGRFITQRVDAVMAPSLIPQETIGVASGDDTSSAKEIGVWITGFAGKGCQKLISNSGYKSKIAGGMVGVDVGLSDNLLVGLMLARVDTIVSYNGINQGDSTKIPTWLGSLYTAYEFGNNFFIRGALDYGYSNISNKDITSDARGNILSTISSKYRSNSISGEVYSGYRYNLNRSCTLTPSIGVMHIYTTDNAYTETGAGAGNKSFNKKSYHSTLGLMGVGFSRSYNNTNLGATIIPEIHMNGAIKLSGKDPITVSRLNGQEAASFVSKYEAPKSSYKAGSSVTLKKGMVDFCVGYDADISKKYLGHQGYLKVKVRL